MLYSSPLAAGYQLAGLRTLLLAPWSGAALFSYATPALSTITNFSGLSGWQRFDLERGSEFGEVPQVGKLGEVCPQLIAVALSGLSAEQRSTIQALLTAGPVVALCEDYSRQWWLYGQDFGLRLLSATTKGGAFRGESGHSLPLAGTQLAPARIVSRSRVALLYNNSTNFTQAPA